MNISNGLSINLRHRFHKIKDTLSETKYSNSAISQRLDLATLECFCYMFMFSSFT